MRFSGSTLKILIILSAVVGTSYSKLAEAAPLEKKAAVIVKELESTKHKLADEDMFRRKVMGSLYGINKRMKSMAKKKTELTDHMLSAKSEVSNLARQIAILELKIKDQRHRVAKYIRTAYALRGRSSIQVLLESNSVRDLDRSLRFLKLFTDRDYKVIREYQSNIQLLLVKREVLNKQVEKLIVLKNKVQTQENGLTREQDSKMKLLGKLREERKRQIAKMESLRVKSKTVNPEVYGAEVLEMLEVSIYEKKGNILPPVSGPIVQEFGLIEDEEYRFKIPHKGLYFRVPEGAEVRSIFKGRVAFAGPLPGYGKAIVLDHGDNYYSVYSFNREVKVVMGDKVKEGDVLALSGTGSQHFGPGVYLEIRHFSDAVDPLPWLKINSDLRASSL